MTVAEFKAWTTETESSRDYWVSDPIAEHKMERLWYRGGVNGRYVHINRNGLLTMGYYYNAVPHIGVALFKVRFRKQFIDFNSAFTRVLEIGGTKFIGDMLS